MNVRQQWVFDQIQKYAEVGEELYGDLISLHEMWKEEFKTGKDNDMSPSASDPVDLSLYGVEYSDLNQYINNICADYKTFWDGSGTLTAAERGKFARRVRKGYPVILG